MQYIYKVRMRSFSCEKVEQGQTIHILHITLHMNGAMNIMFIPIYKMCAIFGGQTINHSCAREPRVAGNWERFHASLLRAGSVGLATVTITF